MQLSRQARDQLTDLDNLLEEIEQYQNETDQMAGDMQEINALLQRGSNSNEEQKRGLSKEDIKKLKLFTYIKVKNEEDICSICLVAAKKGDRMYEMVCKHMFHQKCISPWLEKSTVCPNCRRDLQPKNTLPELTHSNSNLANNVQ